MLQTLEERKNSVIKVATEGLSIEESIERLFGNSNWMELFTRKNKEVTCLFTCYYPYYFSEWKVRVPRYLFREGKALIRIGVNGLTGVASQTELWPKNKEVEVEDSNLLPFKVLKKEADEGYKGSLETFVYKTMRPLQPPKYELTREAAVYLPYYVFLVKSTKNYKIFVVESLSGVKAPLNKIPEIKNCAVFKQKNSLINNLLINNMLERG